MNPNETLEIKARAFEIMTGHVAPFKDSPVTSSESLLERRMMWDHWSGKHSRIIESIFRAISEQDNP